MALAECAQPISAVRWAILLHNQSINRVKEFITSLSLGKNFAKSVADLISNINISKKDQSDIVIDLAKIGKSTAYELLEVVRVVDNTNYQKILTIL